MRTKGRKKDGNVASDEFDDDERPTQGDVRRTAVEIARDVHLSVHSDWVDFSRVHDDADAFAFAPTPSVGFCKRAPARERVRVVVVV